MKDKLIAVPRQDWLADYPDITPQPARNFVPKWFKDLPIDNKEGLEKFNKLIPNNRTVKTCPSFVDVFNEGYVLPAPCDIWFRVTSRNDWEWRTATDFFHDADYNLIQEHGEGQMIDFLPNKNIRKIFKIHYPWFFITPKGYNLRQVPLFYHYENTDWHVPYGVLMSDKYHEVNPQICITTDKEEILIKRGEPLNYLIPYKRETIDLKIGKWSKYKNKINSAQFNAISKFRSNYHTYK